MLQHLLLLGLLGGAVAVSTESPKQVAAAVKIAEDIVNQLSQIANIGQILNRNVTGPQLSQMFTPLHYQLFADCNSKLPKTAARVVNQQIASYSHITIRNYFIATYACYTQILYFLGLKADADHYVQSFKEAGSNPSSYTFKTFYQNVNKGHGRSLAPFGYCATLNTQLVYFIDRLADIEKQ